MKILNGEIESFILFLHNLELSGKSSRMRSRIIKILSEQFKRVEEERIQLLKENSMKDEETGEPIKQEANGKVQYVIENQEKADKEYIELMSEEFVIEENESNKMMLLSVRKSVLDYDEILKGQEAQQWDRWCDILEEIEYE